MRAIFLLCIATLPGCGDDQTKLTGGGRSAPNAHPAHLQVFQVPEDVVAVFKGEFDMPSSTERPALEADERTSLVIENAPPHGSKLVYRVKVETSLPSGPGKRSWNFEVFQTDDGVYHVVHAGQHFASSINVGKGEPALEWIAETARRWVRWSVAATGILTPQQ